MWWRFHPVVSMGWQQWHNNTTQYVVPAFSNKALLLLNAHISRTWHRRSIKISHLDKCHQPISELLHMNVLDFYLWLPLTADHINVCRLHFVIRSTEIPSHDQFQRDFTFTVSRKPSLQLYMELVSLECAFTQTCVSWCNVREYLFWQ